MADREYYIDAFEVSLSGLYNVQLGCSDWIAINMGDTLVRVDNVVLLPRTAPGLSGGSFSPDARGGEIYNRRTFSVIFIAPLGTAPLVQIVQKIYV